MLYVSVTIEVITKLDKDSVQRLQRQRETLIAQNISDRYPFQNSIFLNFYDTVAQLLLLNDTIEKEYTMEDDNDMTSFANYTRMYEQDCVRNPSSFRHAWSGRRSFVLGNSTSCWKLYVASVHMNRLETLQCNKKHDVLS